MHMICYMSEHTGSEAELDSDLKHIVQAAKRNNPKFGITGVLLHHRGKFIQVIEGPEPNLRSLYEILKTDKRHRCLNILIDTPVDKRGFEEWNMDSFNLSRTAPPELKEMEKIRDAYKRLLIPRSDTLVSTYKILLEEGIFRE